MKRMLVIPALAVLVPVAGLANAAVASSGYGTAAVTVADTNQAPAEMPRLLDVKVGHHSTYDRVVFHFSSHAPGYTVRYVPRVTSDPSDKLVSLAGSAFIHVTMQSVASGQVGASPAPQGRQRPNFPQLRELAGAGDFEGHVSFGLGLASKNGFRAVTLTNPNRLVIDVRIPSTSAASSSSGTTELPSTGVPLSLLAVGGLALAVVGSGACVWGRMRSLRLH